MKNIFKHIISWILQREASLLINRHKPYIIAVAGSVGKTSTTAAIYTALMPFVNVRKSEKSFNSELGIPLTILGLPTGWNNPLKWMGIVCKGLFYAIMLDKYPKYLILEVGSDHPGDIDRVVKWLPVSLAVLTRFPETPVHVEFFKDGHAVNEEDKKILKALKKDGIIIMNADDSNMSDIDARYGSGSEFKHRIISYGTSSDATIRAENIKVTYTNDEAHVPTGMQCTAHIVGQEYPLSIAGSLGNQHIYPLLSALAVVHALGFDIAKSVPVLINHESPKGRMRIIPGLNGSTIIDDTYNSSPVAVEEALNTLAFLEAKGKKIAILGDMLELGTYTEREHIRLGKKAADIVDNFITVGLRAEDFITGALHAGADKNKTHAFSDVVTALNYIKKYVGEGDIILIKGSQGTRLEKIVKYLMADQNKAKDLLVRQEKEWEGK